MKELLQTISRLYVDGISEALNNLQPLEKLYVAFVPYFGWDAYPSDHAEHGQRIYAVPSSYRSSIERKHASVEAREYYLYGWGEFINGAGTVSIESEELYKALLQWYEYQQSDNCDIDQYECLCMIGSTLADACMTLNLRKWSSDYFTDDFVVFTDCMAMEKHEHGLAHCVPDQWMKRMLAEGMFQNRF